MPKHNVSSNAFCPFYRYDDRALICCEGIMDGSTFHIAFASTKKKDAFFAARCACAKYGRCPIAKLLENHYENVGVRGTIKEKAGGSHDRKEEMG